jgi:hypothetical protein
MMRVLVTLNTKIYGEFRLSVLNGSSEFLHIIKGGHGALKSASLQVRKFIFVAPQRKLRFLKSVIALLAL